MHIALGRSISSAPNRNQSYLVLAAGLRAHANCLRSLDAPKSSHDLGEIRVAGMRPWQRPGDIGDIVDGSRRHSQDEVGRVAAVSRTTSVARTNQPALPQV